MRLERVLPAGARDYEGLLGELPAFRFAPVPCNKAWGWVVGHGLFIGGDAVVFCVTRAAQDGEVFKSLVAECSVVSVVYR